VSIGWRVTAGLPWPIKRDPAKMLRMPSIWGSRNPRACCICWNMRALFSASVWPDAGSAASASANSPTDKAPVICVRIVFPLVYFLSR